jgi:hypothetical protein
MYENPEVLNRDPEHFVDISLIGIDQNSHVINLVDNEGFKKALDLYISRNQYQKDITYNGYYFSAGVNLFNGQAYYNKLGDSYYTIDHSDVYNDFEEVRIVSCADADAAGTEDNPEQMFIGNDIAASLLANLFQTVLTEAIFEQKINFVSGQNINVNKSQPYYKLIADFIHDYIYNTDEISQARAYVARYGKEMDTTQSAKHYAIVNRIAALTTCI